MAVFAVAHQQGIVQRDADAYEREAMNVLYLTADGEHACERWYLGTEPTTFSEVDRAFPVDTHTLEPTGERAPSVSPRSRAAIRRWATDGALLPRYTISTSPTTGGDSMTDATDAFMITLSPSAAPRRRLRFEPRSDGEGWWYIEDEWSGCGWRPVGREAVKDVTQYAAVATQQ